MGTIADKLTYLNDTKTAIKDSIIAKGVSVSDSDTFRSYAGKIGQISGGSATKFGASVDTFFGDVVDGVLQKPTEPTELNFAGVTEIGEQVFRYMFYERANNITSVDLGSVQSIGAVGLQYAFYNCTGITSINLSSLQSVGNGGLQSAFYGCTGITGALDLGLLQNCDEYSGLRQAFYRCTGITSVDLSSLQSVGTQSMENAFSGCKGITSVDLSSLVSVGQSGMSSAFYNCSGLTSVDLSSLQSVGERSMGGMFSSCTSLTTISFPSLTSVQTNSFGSAMFGNCPNLTEIHFRADMQATIEAMDGYDSKWGATNATIYFDL